MKKKIFILFNLIIVFIGLIYNVSAVENDELIQIGAHDSSGNWTIYSWQDYSTGVTVRDRNNNVKSTKYWHMDDGVLRDGEDFDKFTPEQLTQITADYKSATKCGFGYVDCPNHGDRWQKVINWGFDGYYKSDLIQWYERVVNGSHSAIYMGYTCITELINRLNTENPLDILKTHASVFCIKHNHPLRYRSVFAGKHKGDSGVQTSFVMDDYYTLVWTDYNDDDTEGASLKTGTTRNLSDWFNMPGAGVSGDERNSTIVNYSNVKFIHSEEMDLKAIQHPFGGTFDFAYIASFTEKSKPSTEYDDNGIKKYTGTYSQEIGQLAIWANTGNVSEGADVSYGDDYEEGDPSGVDETSFFNTLYEAATAFDSYEEQVTEHGTTVKVTADEHAGAVIRSKDGVVGVGGESSTYRIGPFYMSDYAYAYCAKAVYFSGDGLDVDKGLLGGIIDGYVTLRSDSGVDNKLYIDGKNVKIVYKNYDDAATNDGDNDRKGSIPDNRKKYWSVDYSWEAPTKSDNAASGVSGYIYPWPNSTFYIDINTNLCRESETLINMHFDYRRTETEGRGWVLKSKMIKHEWTVNTSTLKPSSCTYYCTLDECLRENLTYNERSDKQTHLRYCRDKGYCTHGYSTTHYYCHDGFTNIYCDCGGEYNAGGTYDEEGNFLGYTYHIHDYNGYDCSCNACGKPYCQHGFYNGNHDTSETGVSMRWWGNHYSDNCPGTTKCYTHQHTTCQTGDWQDKFYVTDGQPLMGIHHATTTVTSNNYGSEYGPGTVRITTDISVEKYITKVEHAVVPEVTFNSLEREYETKDYKANNSIKLERGDKVTFYIDLHNRQSESVTYLLADRLPIYEDISISAEIWYYPSITEKEDLHGWWTSDRYLVDMIKPSWYFVYGEIDGNTYMRFTIELTVAGDKGLDSNEVWYPLTNTGIIDGNLKLAETYTNFSIPNAYVRTDKDRANVSYGPVVNRAEVRGQKLNDADYYYIKSYNVPIDKYITNVQHATTGEDVYNQIQAVRDGNAYTSEEKYFDRDVINESTETFKKNSSVYLEYGDIVTYRIDMQNTWYNYDGTKIDRNSAPYYDPDGVRVKLKDTLPSCADKSTLKLKYVYVDSEGNTETYYFVDNKATIVDWRLTNKNPTADQKEKASITYNLTYSVSDDILTIDNLPVTEATESYLEVSFIVNTPVFGTYENKVEIDELRNINDVDVHNESPKTKSSDFFTLNEYKAILDNYVVSTDASMLKQNAADDFEHLYTYSTDLTQADANKVTQNNVADTVNVATASTHNRSTYDEAKREEIEQDKYDYSVPIEKGEIVTFNIRVQNTFDEDIITNTSSKYQNQYATQVRTSKIKNYLESGLSLQNVTAKIYNPGKTALDVTSSLRRSKVDETINDKEYSVYTYELLDKVGENYTLIDPGGYIIYTVTAKITKSNMYLYNLENKAEIIELTNINDGKNYSTILKNKYNMPNLDPIIRTRIVTDQNTVEENQVYSSEYVRLKDLIISGKVWLDYDKDGYMSSYDGLESLGNNENSNVHEERFMKDIVVKLYSIKEDGTLTLERTTKTDENGLYTFARLEEENESRDYRTGINQRVDKAYGKTSTGIYPGNNKYINYYVEYEYDGVLYKSTEVYSGNKNLDNFGDLLDSSDGSQYVKNGIEKYKIDSNAQDITTVREEFNKVYETMTYNKSYEMDGDGTTGEKGSGYKDLIFEKDGHVSYLKTDYSRNMTSRSFLYTYNADKVKEAYEKVIKYCTAYYWKTCYNHQKYWQVLIDEDIINPDKYANTTDGRNKAKTELNNIYEEIIKNRDSEGNTQITKYLWLYDYNEINGDKVPETEYLKYINLGLEEREDIDISLMKDVYEVKTTINGEEMTYSFDQLEVEQDPGVLNGEIPEPEEEAEDTKQYLQDYIIKEPYGLSLYESDFRYRYEQYLNNAVKAAKGTESELNIEITYKITVDSKEVTVDEPNMQDKDRELDVTIQEIMDVYDENFIKFTEDETEDFIYVKGKDKNDVLENQKLEIAEAWYFENNDVSKDKVELEVSNTSNYSDRIVNFEEYGYNTLYIRGMDDAKIGEGEKLDVYIKYVVKKDTEADLLRTLQIIEETMNKHEGRGLENIAQVNAYSVWYEDSGKPASIVDCDSNVGSIGLTSKGVNTNVDFYEFYEDTAYKTGIEIEVENYTTKHITDSTGNTMSQQQINNDLSELDSLVNAKKSCSHDASNVRYIREPGSATAYTGCIDCAHYGWNILYFLNDRDLADYHEYYTLSQLLEMAAEYEKYLKGEQSDDDEELIRTISGKVWDDSRSEEEDQQYHGNGEYTSSDSKLSEAKLNENVSVNYDNDATHDNEEKDILVRSAKVEYVEIVPVGIDTNNDGKYDEVRYYEETLNSTKNKWPSVQNIRTDKNGEYTLSGFIPGNYILRYTYGDDSNNKDMLIFNGHDYKSTTYTGVEDDIAYGNEVLNIEADPDKVIKIMEIADKSDARDDEIRRLETMAYSETMVSKKAEVLKGTANGTIESLKSEEVNTSEEYKELTDNTYMEADTVKFYVKPEKLEKLTNNPTRSYLESTVYSYVLKPNDEIIYSNLFDIVYDDTKVSERTYSIKNLDFGIEYRPETQISLSKAISAVILKASDGNTLVKLALETENFGQGKLQQNVIKEDSIGLEYTQFISNNYTTLNPYDLTSEDYQGFVFINVDEDILQGSTIEIEYTFTAENNSEIDRVSKNLDDIRYEENAVTQENEDKIRYVKLDDDGTLYSSIGNDSNKYLYTASGTARQILYDEFYGTANGEEYRKNVQTGYTDYYGRYLGQTYYTGDQGENDIVASVKFDKILDYVDTDLVFKSTTEKDTLWSTTTDKYLLGDDETRGLFIKKNLFTSDNKLINSKGINYVTYNEDGITPMTSNLVISVDDRVKDADEYAEGKDPTINTGLSKFLEPYALGNADNSRGTIKIQATKVISAETSTDDMQYENLAEVIQYTSQTARRTNYATTIGNANALLGEFDSAKTELDTSATEVISLTPPTGLDRVNRVVRDTVEVASAGIGIIVIVVALVVGGIFLTGLIIKKIKKRPIK